MKLFKHQQDIIDADPKKCGLFLGTGSGKTITALMLAEGKTLVVTTKTVRDDRTWERNLEKLDKHKVTELCVLSKEEMRRDAHMMPYFDTEIYDESHTVTGVSPQIVYKRGKGSPKMSQVFEAIWGHIKSQKPKRLYLLTATPIRNPMAVLAHAWLLGKDWDFLKFRETYYFKLPIHGREIWSPKVTTVLKERLGKAVQGLGFTGRLEDFIDVPDQTHKVINVPLTKEQEHALVSLPLEFPDPIVLVGKKHQVEQGVLKGDQFNLSQKFKTGKLEVIEDLYEEFGKVLVFAKYTEQIEQIADHFASKCPVYTLTGATKDRGTLMEQAEKSTNCIVVAQSSVSAGYELPSFRCTIYASESYSHVDNVQSLGRTLRINNPQKNLYVYLLSGEIDKAVRRALETKQDFSEKMYAEARS